MLYWLIPYLVAYNASDTGDWKYGPEHVFKAEVHFNATMPTDVTAGKYSDIVMDFACRPMNSSLIQCRIDSATMDNYNVKSDRGRWKLKPNDQCGICNTVFQVEFNEEGISRVWFLNTNSSYRMNMIRAIIGTMNTGISLGDKEFENYDSLEKSIIGICDTSFNIGKKVLPEEEKEQKTVIEGYKFFVPSLGARSGDETIVIEKDRNVNQCVKKTPYFFGSREEEDSIYELKAGLKLDTLIVYSQSRIYLGEKSFSTHTENLGTVILASSKKSIRKEMRTGEMIRVSLQSIRPAKEELRNIENLVNVGAGFEPGTPWPERNEIKSKIRFFV